MLQSTGKGKWQTARFGKRQKITAHFNDAYFAYFPPFWPVFSTILGFRRRSIRFYNRNFVRGLKTSENRLYLLSFAIWKTDPISGCSKIAQNVFFLPFFQQLQLQKWFYPTILLKFPAHPQNHEIGLNLCCFVQREKEKEQWNRTKLTLDCD